MLAVRWYLRYGLSYRDVEELLAERGVRSTTSLSTGGSSGSHRSWPKLPAAPNMGSGPRWQVDETYVKIAGCWRYVYRAVNEYGR